ncbi:hypothetical protein TNCV_3507731 [Trichonephila clavipes]|uniref:Secreted protein n=1 Tax=Trichonephila clavipes TaxID=2585209 RepID=A0A8X6S155_TRICX|nr:hypothetical protein TNCV_3507731 [Trichonephila clavipes]
MCLTTWLLLRWIDGETTAAGEGCGSFVRPGSPMKEGKFDLDPPNRGADTSLIIEDHTNFSCYNGERHSDSRQHNFVYILRRHRNVDNPHRAKAHCQSSKQTPLRSRKLVLQMENCS